MLRNSRSKIIKTKEDENKGCTTDAENRQRRNERGGGGGEGRVKATACRNTIGLSSIQSFEPAWSIQGMASGSLVGVCSAWLRSHLPEMHC